MKLSRNVDAKLDLQVSPLIDVVFLLIIYFMVAASLIRKEADIGFMLPMPSPEPIRIPVEVLVEIAPDGAVEVEGMRFSKDDHSLNELAKQIAGLRKMAALQQSEFFVSIAPHNEALHRRVIDVMDACSAAGVEKLGFSKSI
ncbi:MAG: biopolymer transporter ExbD [Verrucomicrobiota bacterium]